MRHLEKKCATLRKGLGKKKAPQTGEVVCGAKKRTPGKSCSQSLLRLACWRYLETLAAWIAVSWARASLASMGAKLTLPPRRCRTNIPASWGRVLATPWAFGRISVTVDLVVTM
jgi:hypothetical protein